MIKHGTDWIWNDLVNTDQVRWRVIPLAILLSVVYGVVLKLVREPRWVTPHLNPLAAADGEPVTPTLWALAVIPIVGIASLVGGASLGPEAPLVALAMGMGLFVAGRVQMGPAGQVLVLASIGALLVAFFGSLIPLLIPVLVLYQRTKRLAIPALLSIAACGLARVGHAVADPVQRQRLRRDPVGGHQRARLPGRVPARHRRRRRGRPAQAVRHAPRRADQADRRIARPGGWPRWCSAPCWACCI